ncbi:MAG: hypothetical protein SAJ12_15045 [Jaaginema sp. PMC 1079.18]|nr:hypothetical protein [Jaaginema sp. PMC 1080.18]MEC4852302.1 hypothetical protein [Jaaginema sp. PMC 1079.18]MEC4866611.1 hypothetical protein [Jaaginema sp. PMC 1078.18]
MFAAGGYQKMVAIAFVITVNLLITCVNCYIAWRVWQWRRRFRQTTRVLTRVEQRLHRFFLLAPDVIRASQGRSRTLRQLDAQLSRQLQQLQQLLTILGWLPLLWRSLRRPKRS